MSPVSARGFTLVEVVLVLVLMGILAAVAIPRWRPADFEAAYLHEEVRVALRYAQRQAVVSGCTVAAALDGSGYRLSYQAAPGHAGCGDRLFKTAAADGVSASAITLYFHPDGRLHDASGTLATSAQTLSIGGQDLIVETTGHVH